MVIVDKLRFGMAWSLYRRQVREISCIDPASPSFYFFQKVLGLAGITVREDIFKLSELEKSADSSMYLKGLRLSSDLATELACYMIESSNVSHANSHFGQNTICLQLSKAYQPIVFPTCLKYVIAQDRYGDDDQIFLELPSVVPIEYNSRLIQKENINFYSVRGSTLDFHISTFVKNIKKCMRNIYLSYAAFRLRSEKIGAKNAAYAVLSFKEDSVGSDARLRTQQFWVQGNNRFEHYVFEASFQGFLVHRAFKAGNTTILPFGYLGLALRHFSNDHRLREVHDQRTQILKGIPLVSSVAQRYALRVIETVFERSIEIGAMSLFCNTSKFVFKETHNIYSDAIQLVSARVGVETVCMQYSNLVIKNCQMLTTADKFLLFSPLFEEVFSDGLFASRNFIVTGYPYRQAIKHIKARAEQRREKFESQGVSMVVGYFDENVHPGKFSLIDRQAHQEEIVALARAVVDFPRLAIIVKTQFMRNSIENSYRDVDLVNEAVSTGRLLGISEGEHRNNIYPAEIAISSDICVGHAFGATASLESALTGARSILINDFNIRPFYEDLLNENLTFGTVDEFISYLRKINFDPNSFGLTGDWSEILHFFDPFTDIYSYDRIAEAIFN